MRAFAVRSFGEAPALHDLPVPAADGAFLLRVAYAGVNPLDNNNNLARLTADSAYPHVLGIDFAGVVERVPAGGSDLHSSRRARRRVRVCDDEVTTPCGARFPGGRADIDGHRRRRGHRHTAADSPAGARLPDRAGADDAEANAAVVGAFDGGATSAVVNDSHGPMDNLLGEQLDQRADYVVGDPKPLDMMQEVTPPTGVVLFVGYHAGAADPAGVLAHTYSGRGFAEVRLNGRSISEAELNALMAAGRGRPGRVGNRR